MVQLVKNDPSTPTFSTPSSPFSPAGSEIPIDTKDVFGKYLVYMEGKSPAVNKYKQNKEIREQNIWANEIELKRSHSDEPFTCLPNAQLIK
jgi:hypothetical protein